MTKSRPLCLLVLSAALGGAWLVHEFVTKGPSAAIANLNTYNFLFLSDELEAKMNDLFAQLSGT